MLNKKLVVAESHFTKSRSAIHGGIQISKEEEMMDLKKSNFAMSCGIICHRSCLPKFQSMLDKHISIHN